MSDAFAFPGYLLGLILLAWTLEAFYLCYSVHMFRRRELRYARRTDSIEPYRGGVVVMTAIKGVDPHLKELLDGIMRQDYPSYRLVFIVETKQDPTFGFLKGVLEGWAGGEAVETTPITTAAVRREGETDAPDQDVHVLTWAAPDGERVSPGLTSIELIVAGLSHREAQKIHGQRVALKLLHGDDEALVFADADAAMGPDWLATLVGPLNRQEVGLATVWRWIVPRDGAAASLPTKIASIANAAAVTLMGRNRNNHAWGGSMALRRDTIEEIDLGEHWRGCINDDVSISRAIKAIRKRIYMVPGAFVVSPDAYDWAGLWKFGRRQHLFTKTYAPHIWGICAFGMVLYTVSFVAALIKFFSFTPGWAWAGLVMAVVFAFDFKRARLRRLIIEDILPPDAVERLRGVWALEQFGTPLVMAVHGAIAVSALYAGRFTWGGITYRIGGRRGRGTRVLQRHPYPDATP